MLQRYSIIVILASLISAVAWWSNPMPVSSATSSSKWAPGNTGFTYLSSDRQELLDNLRQLVVAQHVYRAKNGTFTRILGRLDSSATRALSTRFGFQVEEAGSAELLISGFSEVNGRIVDRASLNQEFGVSASFPVPRENILKLKEQGRIQLADADAALERQDRKLAQSDPEIQHEPETVLSDLLKRMPSQAALRPGQRESNSGLDIEPLEF